ncbi:MAG: endopeptidase La [Eubacteriales bacterium]
MSEYIEKAEKLTLPVLPLREAVAFPGIPISFEINDDIGRAAVDAANSADRLCLIVCAKNTSDSEVKASDLYRVGTVARLRQTAKSSSGVRIICEGLSRATVSEYRKTGKLIEADALSRTVELADDGGIRGEAYVREALEIFDKIVGYIPSVTTDIKLAAHGIKSPSLLADFIASSILVKYTHKQEVLEEFEPLPRIFKLIRILNDECDLLECEQDIHRKVREGIARNQRDYYLREQMKVIEDELGGGEDPDDYAERIQKAKLPDEVREKLLKENERLSRTPFGSAEATVLRSYLDTCLEIPWNARTRDRVSVSAAQKVLDADHEGLDKVKTRILEFLAVKQLNPDLKNQIICLVGPPGTGKTSVAASIAHAMNRKYVRVSLGGVRDEADIRGHRKTYVAAMPGRIIDALIKAKVKNPLILLDEVDKLTADAHGDPASALLEVLDPEQNKSFRDHFVELPFDLSECLFITTANTLETVPRPLIDRMEVIELSSYTRREKLAIAKNHLIPKQLKRHGLNRRALKLTDEAIYEVIDCYTREAGVRNLERTVAELCRKAAKRMVDSEGKLKSITIDKNDVASYLGARKLMPEKIDDEDLVGVVNGLAYTEDGGDLLKIEAAVLDGTGKLELTGKLGDVMKESAEAALSFVRQVAPEYGINTDFYKTKDIHIHVPEGAVPKDGPSAGVTMVTALVSALSKTPVAHDIAMTGEVTLTGRVLPIGGLREKTMAAYSAGVHTVLIPKANVGDLDEIDPEARAALEFIPVSNVKEVLGNALVRPMPAVEPAKNVIGATIPASATPAVVITTINEHPMQGVNADGA